MQIQPFRLERYFAAHEFSAEHLLSASDCESLTATELLALADADSLRLWQDLRLGYTESQGLPDLRAQVALLYEQIAPSDVLIAAPEEAIFLAMNVLLRPGDHVIVTCPAYQSLYAIAEALGCRVTRWMLTPGEERWSLDLEFLRSAITPATRLIVLNFPHNPTGALLARADLMEILDLAAANGSYIFGDDMYRLLEPDPALRLPPICDLYERGISLSGLSKAFALPGLRIGWLALRDRALLAEIATFKDYTTICASAPSEVLALIALRARDLILRRNLDIIEANVSEAERFFAANAAMRWIPPQAGSVALGWLTTGEPVYAFCQGLMAHKRTMLLPGTVFEYEGETFRLGLGRRDLPQGLARLAEYLSGKW